MDKLRIIVTGGTFDKTYDPVSEQLTFWQTHVPEMLEKARFHLAYQIETPFMVDSLFMSNLDRAAIAEKCKVCEEKNIVITHGTGTMVETAQAIARLNLDKTVVLTGAMVPYQIDNSDAFFNLGGAVVVAQCLPHGVFIVMNGEVFPHDNVRKNLGRGEFEKITYDENK